MNTTSLKEIVWAGSSKKDIRELPEDVKDELGQALFEVQCGMMPASAKPLKGFGGASVLEIRENYHSDTYRAVYTVRFVEYVYVLHVFQKKSKQGHETSRAHLDLIRDRLQWAQQDYQTRQEAGQRGR